ncbi:alpha/beta hydrolase [Iodidimonas nitroreducens]|uniref:Alpha/beta hydrolase n=1 Tax=Iodidimonas nitroreducens TaxID=1236968 RepID=A0A5A7N5N5_9PROT|nr:alpha/beta fold hydrolase [Iodidimonas nitroreducens]GAK33674.1 poly-beta-hydroxybutyrate polymerase [alpha proteobacterium Q-1]GER03611.1 alpha/beta hydrolase [Iodidimonas nitroreducens]
MTRGKQPPLRAGPKPLGLHLAMMSAAAMMAHAKNPAAGDKNGTDQLSLALQGIDLWRAHPFRRPDSGLVRRHPIGQSSLLDIAAARRKSSGGEDEKGQTPASRKPVLLVPSLINPPTILDLLPDNSLAGFLYDQGFAPMLLDWGAPGAMEHDFGLADYCARIHQMIDHLVEAWGGPVPVIGYCMGGTLALAAAGRAGAAVERLACLAAPWDFHADGAVHQGLARMAMPLLPLIAHLGEAPMDLIQSFFISLSPDAALRKFSHFARMPQDGPDARLFVALEDWLNEGPPLAGPAATEVLRDWYVLNSPMRGCWQMGSEMVSARDYAGPVFCAVPQNDRIVPPQSALGLVAGFHPDHLVRPSSGHVGMIVGRRARTDLWMPLSKWLQG